MRFLIILCTLFACSTLNIIQLTPVIQPTSLPTPQVSPAWMISRSALDWLQEAGLSDGQLQRIFGSSNTYVIGEVPQGWQSRFSLSFTSYADLSRQYSTNAVSASVQAFIYDNEAWSFTPLQEQQDFSDYVKQVADLVHLHHRILIATPAVDLVHVLDLSFTGNRYERFLSLGIMKEAAAYADVVEIQAQGSESDVTQYAQFVASAAAQAKSANPHIVVFAGLSTNPSGQKVTGEQLYLAYQATRSLVSGYWLNIPSDQGGYCPRCGTAEPQVAIDFLHLIVPTDFP